MIKDIKGLHHVTSMAADAAINNRFFTDTLGLRRAISTRRRCITCITATRSARPDR